MCCTQSVQAGRQASRLAGIMHGKQYASINVHFSVHHTANSNSGGNKNNSCSSNSINAFACTFAFSLTHRTLTHAHDDTKCKIPYTKTPPTSNGMHIERASAFFFSPNIIHHSFALAACTYTRTHKHSQTFRVCVFTHWMWSKYQFEFYNVPLEIGDMLFQVKWMCPKRAQTEWNRARYERTISNQFTTFGLHVYALLYI